MHSPKPPFAHSLGPRNAKIALVGEAFGAEEEKTGLPFMGQSGQELSRMLQEAGIKRSECFLSNVLTFRPPENKIETLCSKKADLPKDYAFPPISMGKYLQPEYLGELERLQRELEEVRPNLVIALGNVACWALLRSSGITSLRGTVTTSPVIPGQKVLPTYHPAAVLRNWAYRPIVLADFMKGKREADFADVRRPSRFVLVDPTLAEIDDWIARHAVYSPAIGVDIETMKGQIDCIGFSISPIHALCIPFVTQGNKSYWPDPADEIRAWQIVQSLLLLPAKKVFQNGLYDMQYLLRMGLRLHNVAEDTMLLHHALFPEMPKGLGFLGSIYTNESSWKLLNRGKHEELKKDE
jgi:uracil-DNA glycosylase